MNTGFSAFHALKLSVQQLQGIAHQACAMPGSRTGKPVLKGMVGLLDVTMALRP